MTMKDEWLLAAMTDDKLIVDLLLRLKQSPEPIHNIASSSRSTKPVNLTLPPFDWGMRQPRSKLSLPSSSFTSAKKETTRRSPTTPLSWSTAGGGGNVGSGSPSDGCGESGSISRPCSSEAAVDGVDRFRSSGCRSKGAAANENTTNTTSSGAKRPRKKKTIWELKEAENSLIKEQTRLSKELQNMRSTVDKQRSLNENLKRIKLDLRVESGAKKSSPKGKNSPQREPSTTTTLEEQDPSYSVQKRHLQCESAASSSVQQQNKDCPIPPQQVVEHNEEEDRDAFMLPDLNMMPDLNKVPDTVEAASMLC